MKDWGGRRVTNCCGKREKGGCGGETHVAEATDLVVGLALGVEVGSSLTTTHVKAGESVLEDLLETEELEDGKVDGRVETETTLVRAEDRRELDTETVVDLALALCE
jgi:hypothetical protein